jgi:hypothetical protein
MFIYLALPGPFVLATGFLASVRRGGGTTGGSGGFSGLEEDPDSSVTEASAGSVATRGLLFANQHPAQRR